MGGAVLRKMLMALGTIILIYTLTPSLEASYRHFKSK